MMPKAFRQILDVRGESTVYVTYAPTPPMHLEVRPATSFMAYQQRFTHIAAKSAALEKFALLYFGSAVRVDIDRAGRILVPAEQRRRIGLGDTAAFVGVDADRFQIWRPSDLDSVFDDVLENHEDILAELGSALAALQ